MGPLVQSCGAKGHGVGGMADCSTHGVREGGTYSQSKPRSDALGSHARIDLGECAKQVDTVRLFHADPLVHGLHHEYHRLPTAS